MNALHLDTLTAKTQRFLSIVVLACVIVTLIAALAPPKVLATGTSCDTWRFRGCCECWWPCRQDYNSRNCWNGPHSWEEWNCACPSVCDHGC